MPIRISRRFWRDCEKEGTTRLHVITQRRENERYCDGSIVGIRNLHILSLIDNPFAQLCVIVQAEFSIPPW
ncbi:hypothetical protein C5S29_04585 [ANME-1 cluster archaeon GoMg3.2]|nr:hypothetical protein [ANME-1 cluster archaeon GoMg3.2]